MLGTISIWICAWRGQQLLLDCYFSGMLLCFTTVELLALRHI